MKEQRLVRRSFVCVYLLQCANMRKKEELPGDDGIICDCWKNPKAVSKKN
jgi:hypothetical protein